jgi:hypothetical protein
MMQRSSKVMSIVTAALGNLNKKEDKLRQDHSNFQQEDTESSSTSLPNDTSHMDRHNLRPATPL